MTDRKKIMSDLEGLTYDDWHMYHCDTDVQGIAIDALEFLQHDEQTIESLQNTINKLTKALAEKPEQKHGHWIRSPKFLPETQCSVCKNTYVGDYRTFKFCPECGARMDEEVKQNETD